MIPRELKKDWLNSDSHKNIAKHMIVEDNFFRIEKIKIQKVISHNTDIHIQFYLDDELEFISSTEPELIEIERSADLAGAICDLIVTNTKTFLEVTISSLLDGQLVAKYRCCSLTMGPVYGKRIYI